MKRFFPVFSMAIALVACGQKAPEGVTKAWVRLPAVTGNPGAAYFDVTGGAKDARLMEISSPQAIRAEMHESSMAGGMMQMRPLDNGVAIPAGQTVHFAPGGKHVMLFDLNPKVQVGDKITLRFSYADGRKVEAQADVKPLDDDGGMAEHTH